MIPDGPARAQPMTSWCVAATGKQVTLTGIIIYGVVDGVIQEEMGLFGSAGSDQQLVVFAGAARVAS